jgi:hypothetical protein
MMMMMDLEQFWLEQNIYMIIIKRTAVAVPRNWEEEGIVGLGSDSLFDARKVDN